MELNPKNTVKLTHKLNFYHIHRDTHVIVSNCKVSTLSSPALKNGRWALFVSLAIALGMSSPKGFAAAGIQTEQAPCPTLLKHEFPRLQDEKNVSMCSLAGKVVLVVNTASYCGYTSQYNELEKIHQQYKDQGFSVLGFPSNDFGGQEPKSNKQIADFCANTFGVQFPMMAKSSVRGPSANPFYKQLAAATGQEPAWNFHKYLIDRQGKVIGVYPSGVSPLNKTLVTAIRSALEAPTR